jgi:integrase
MLTDRKLRALRPKPTDYRVPDYEKGDDPTKALRGFGVRVLTSGVITFYLDYRVGGVERRPVIASWPNWNVGQARAKAREWRRLIEDGVDPYAEREAARTAPTVRQLAERYIAEHLPRNRPGSRRNYLGTLQRWVLPALGAKKVADVRRADIEALHARVTKSGAKVHANRVVGLCSKLFSLAVKWEYRADNPCKGAVDRNPETKRRRYLSPAEIARLSAALAEESSQRAADAIRLLMMTGARRNEVCAMRWSGLDLEAGTWTKEASETKQRREHTIPLAAPALQLLTAIRARANAREEYVFPGRDGTGPLNIRTTWENVRRAAGLEDVHLHDLRHSFASILVSGGASLPLIGALLGHSNPATTHRYAHLALDPLREAAERVGAVITGGEGAEVVPLPARRKN